MTSADLTVITKYHKLFPELTKSQRDVVLLYSFGMEYQSIARSKNISNKTTINYLTEARERLQVDSLRDVRTITLIRLFSSQYTS